MPASSLLSENKEAIIKAVSVTLSKQVDVQTDKTSFEKAGPVVFSMISTAIDLGVDAAKNGGTPTPANIGIFLAKRATGFAGLSESDQVLCVAALADLAMSTWTDGAVIAGSIASEVGTAGSSTPVSVPLLLASSASLVLAALKAHQQCGPLVTKALAGANDAAFKASLQASQRPYAPP